MAAASGRARALAVSCRTRVVATVARVKQDQARLGGTVHGRMSEHRNGALPADIDDRATLARSAFMSGRQAEGHDEGAVEDRVGDSRQLRKVNLAEGTWARMAGIV